jgi:hypothetical protein
LRDVLNKVKSNLEKLLYHSVTIADGGGVVQPLIYKVFVVPNPLTVTENTPRKARMIGDEIILPHYYSNPVLGKSAEVKTMFFVLGSGIRYKPSINNLPYVLERFNLEDDEVEMIISHSDSEDEDRVFVQPLVSEDEDSPLPAGGAEPRCIGLSASMPSGWCDVEDDCPSCNKHLNQVKYRLRKRPAVSYVGMEKRFKSMSSMK